jgi:hypothetical protein
VNKLTFKKFCLHFCELSSLRENEGDILAKTGKIKDESDEEKDGGGLRLLIPL